MTRIMGCTPSRTAACGKTEFLAISSDENDYRTPRCYDSAGQGHAAARGVSLKQVFIEALEKQLLHSTAETRSGMGSVLGWRLLANCPISGTNIVASSA